MSIATEFTALTPAQRRAVVTRYPDGKDREGYIYEISESTGRFLCRHKKPKHAFIGPTTQKTK